jgi:hypothetical protein
MPTHHSDPLPDVEVYEAPVLGSPVLVTAVTLFSATVDPDGGVIDFGGG